MTESDQFDAEYEELIRQHQQTFRDFVFANFPNHAAVDDIVQETNRVLWEKRTEFELGSNFAAWGRKIAHFQTLSFLKQIKRKSWMFFDSDLVHLLAEAADERDEQREQRVLALTECLNRLQAEDKNLMDSKYHLKLSYRQISEKHARSEGALKQVYLRIRNQLKQCIERKISFHS